MNKKTYTGSKIQNHFTAYLIQFVRGKRHDYLEKKIQMADAEELLEDIGQMEARIVIEELLENQTREQLLLQEAQGKYPEWAYLDLARRFSDMQRSYERAWSKVNSLTDRVEELWNENRALKERLGDFNRVERVLGRDTVKSIVQKEKSLEEVQRMQKQRQKRKIDRGER